MSHAIKLAGAWVEILGSVLLQSALEGEDGGRHDWVVSPAFIESFSPEWRAEKGFVAVVEVDRPAGVNFTSSVEDVDGAPTRTWTHHALSGDDLAQLIRRRKDQIDLYAGTVITQAYPLWKQSNMTARAVDLIDLRTQRSLTSDETAEQAALRAAWGWVASVRAHSNSQKAALPSDEAGAVAFDITAGWPDPPG